MCVSLANHKKVPCCRNSVLEHENGNATKWHDSSLQRPTSFAPCETAFCLRFESSTSAWHIIISPVPFEMVHPQYHASYASTGSTELTASLFHSSEPCQVGRRTQCPLRRRNFLPATTRMIEDGFSSEWRLHSQSLNYSHLASEPLLGGCASCPSAKTMS
jgi:hypothetical protein